MTLVWSLSLALDGKIVLDRLMTLIEPVILTTGYSHCHANLYIKSFLDFILVPIHKFAKLMHQLHSPFRKDVA